MPKGLKERIADFAKIISEIPLPYAQTGKAVATLFDDNEKEASELKEEVEDTLGQQQRIVVTIDDIDRLPAKDIRQLLRIFKAIPNFKNVVYVLVFDKEVVMKTIAETKEISGEAYLEKIIQVAFELPIPDKSSLRRLLFEKLDGIFADTPIELLDKIHWGNIYFQGIDHFIINLRDIVHLTDTLTVTYPAVKGEVNPVDFIAIESLRVFCPMVYNTIIHNPHAFAGEVNTSIDELKNLHNAWIAQLPDEDKQPIKNLLMHLFSKLKFVWGNNYLDEEQLKLREQLRVCSLEIFPIYFRLTFSTSKLSNTQIKAILALAEDADKFREHLIKLANQKRLDGTTQVRAFLEKLENYPQEEIPVNYIPSIVQAFFDLNEELLCAEDESQSIFDLGNEVIISRFISRSLRRLEEPVRFQVLKKAITQGKALTIISHEIATLKEQQSKYGSDKFNLEEEWLLNAQHLKELSEIAATRQQETDTNEK